MTHKKAIDIEGFALQCDKKSCDWTSEMAADTDRVSLEALVTKYSGKPCPTCGETIECETDIDLVVAYGEMLRKIGDVIARLPGMQDVDSVHPKKLLQMRINPETGEMDVRDAEGNPITLDRGNSTTH